LGANTDVGTKSVLKGSGLVGRVEAAEAVGRCVILLVRAANARRGPGWARAVIRDASARVGCVARDIAGGNSVVVALLVVLPEVGKLFGRPGLRVQ